MSKIELPIQPLKFEQIRDRIAFILADELSNQATLQGDDLLNAEVWTERFIGFNSDEYPAIKVYFVGGTYEMETPETNNASYTYYIDVFTKAKKEQDGKNSGDYYSALKTHKLIGSCLAIIQDPEYLTLDFPDNFGIKNRQITDIRIAEPEQKLGDGNNTYSGRLTLTVDVVEDFFPILASDLDGADASVALEESDKGFKVNINKN